MDIEFCKDKKIFYYRIYGLNVKSEVEVPELLSTDKLSDEDIDVFVSYGVIPKEIKDKISKNTWFKYEKNNMYFTIKGVASYYIYDGKNIIVEPCKEGNYQYVKTFLLGTSFGMILSQRNIVAIHGGTILVGDKAITLTGDSGAGKSTLTNAFRHNGYPFMADDVSATKISENGTIQVNPAYPQQKICTDAMEKMGYDIKDYKLIDEGRGKYVIPTHNTFVKEPKSLGAICEIRKWDKDYVEIEEVKGQEKVGTIIRNVYRMEIIYYHGVSAPHFKNIIEVAKKIPLYRIKRPDGKFTVDEQIKCIVDKLEAI